MFQQLRRLLALTALTACVFGATANPSVAAKDNRTNHALSPVATKADHSGLPAGSDNSYFFPNSVYNWRVQKGEAENMLRQAYGYLIYSNGASLMGGTNVGGWGSTLTRVRSDGSTMAHVFIVDHWNRRYIDYWLPIYRNAQGQLYFSDQIGRSGVIWF
jgi:hypothetical protein